MAAGVVPAAQSQSPVQGLGRAARIATLAPYLLALFFCILALRGVTKTDVVDTDAARHAMNGAFIYDLVRTGHIRHPGDYGMYYYGHLPALSMPYHPPVFPLIESVFFALFGVKLLTARLAVAISVGICAFLLYRLTQVSFKSHALAACVTITTLSLTTFQSVARDVMLEFPAMVFTLAALYFMRDMDRDSSAGRALLFATLSAVALWTKQHAVFLGAMPVAYALVRGRPRLPLSKWVWVSSLVFGAAALALLFVSLHFNGAGLDQAGILPQGYYWDRGFQINIRRYGAWIGDNVLGLPGIFAASAVVIYLWAVYRRGRQQLGLSLYLAWIVLMGAVLLVTAGNVRYMFFILPPVIVVAYAMLFRGCTCLWGERRAWYLPAAFAVAWFVSGLVFPVEFLRGPGEAARTVVHDTPTRILYAGSADGNFIFAVRALDPKLRTTVISAEKLPVETFEPAAMERFCRQFGIDWIVLEDVAREHPWSGLSTNPAPSMKLERSIPLESNRSRWQGEIKVYRFSGPTRYPGGTLELPVPKIRRKIGVRL
jgi:4-amino-4-deoxy-L-arabinose transferase-like glycosyltransferase